MQVQIHTDNHIEGTDSLARWATSTVSDGLARFSAHITRVEVHLSDANGGKKTGTENKNCMLEVRLEGRQPLVVNAHADNLNQALDAATDKMLRLIDHTLGRVART